MGTGDEGGVWAARPSADVAGLHRLAAMLTADTEAATALTASTLAAAGPEASAVRLRIELVRAYLRSAPRRVERVAAGDGQDPGEVLRVLPPKARAAAALLLVEEEPVPTVADAVGVRTTKVSALVPPTPDLDVALTALADQHALTGPALQQALGDAAVNATPTGAPATRRRWRWVAAAAAVLVVVPLGYALINDDGPGTVDDEVDTDSSRPEQQDFSRAGWELTEAGDPPQSATGLTLVETVEIGAGETAEVALDSGGTAATFAVLWCDMPPAEDANLEVPRGDVLVEDGSSVEVPCAGRDGSPSVTELVPLPPEGEAQVGLGGDLPPDGAATFAFYTEDQSGQLAPMPESGDAAPPPSSPGATVVDRDSTVSLSYPGDTRLVESVEIGHESTLQVWAGGTGQLSVQIDGVPVTDDGDLQRYSSPTGEVDWSTQRPDLREGRWWVYVPDSLLTLEVPEAVRPAPGERREVVVELTSSGIDADVQVEVGDASSLEVDTSAVAPSDDDLDAPELIAGHRLLGQWQVPLDGRPRELTGIETTVEGPSLAVLALSDDVVDDQRFPGGLFGRGEGFLSVGVHSDLDQALSQLSFASGGFGGEGEVPSGPDDPFEVSLPPAAGQPAAHLVVYARVPYDEFDFSAAAVPPQAWPTGEDRPLTAIPLPDGLSPSASLDQQDLRDGEVSVRLDSSHLTVARVSTSGAGRMLFLLNGTPAYQQSDDGWWSSWTDRPVTTDIRLSDLTSSSSSTEDELTVVVEDYEDFTLEVLTE